MFFIFTLVMLDFLVGVYVPSSSIGLERVAVNYEVISSNLIWGD
jgi:hypothetical protein